MRKISNFILTAVLMSCFALSGAWVAPGEEILPEAKVFRKRISAARYIYTAPDGKVFPLKSYSRLTLNFDEEIESAKFLVFFEKGGNLYVNGQKMTGKPIPANKYRGHIKGSWYDLSKVLKKGKNVIAGQTQKFATPKGCFGWIMRGTVKFKSGKEQVVVTDSKFKSSGTFVENWFAVDFDDSAWKNAHDLGDVMYGPWINYGNVPELYASAEEQKKIDESVALDPVRAKKLAERPDPKFSIAYRGLIPAIKVDNEYLPPVMGGGPGFSAYGLDKLIKEYRAGIRVFRFAFPMDGVSNAVTGEYDLNELSRAMKRFVKVAPDAYVILMVSPDLRIGKFNRENPGELIGYVNPDVKSKDPWVGNMTAGSCASKVYREEQARIVRLIAELCKKNDWGKHVIGFGMWYGPSGDGFPWGFYQGMPDNSKPMTEAFRNFCRNKYKTVAALRKAWADNKVTFETITVPGKVERNARGHYVHDIQYGPERKLTDYYTCYNNEFLEMHLNIGRVWKKLMPNKLFGTYYGYCLLPYDPVGVTALVEKALAAPEIDILFATTEGYNLTAGQTRHLPSVFHRHKKLSMTEGDIRTFVAWRDRTGEPQWSCKTPETTTATLRKLYGNAIYNGMGWHLVSFNSMQQYWFNHPLILTEIHQGVKLWEDAWQKASVSEADVAVIFSPEEKTIHGHPTLPENYGLHTAVEYHTLDALNFSGAVYDYMSVVDYLASPKKYKAVVFINKYTVSDKEAAQLRKKISADKSLAIWNMAPGFVSDHGFSDKAMEKLTGLPLKADMKKGPLHIRLDNKNLMAVKQYGNLCYDSPRVYCKFQPGIEVYGRYPDTAEAALVFKKLKDGSMAAFSGTPLTDRDMVRRLFSKAGVHLYTAHSGLYVRANNNSMMIFASKPGSYEITLPRKVKQVIDWTNGKVIASNCSKFTLTNKDQMTWLLEIKR